MLLIVTKEKVSRNTGTDKTGNISKISENSENDKNVENSKNENNLEINFAKVSFNTPLLSENNLCEHYLTQKVKSMLFI